MLTDVSSSNNKSSSSGSLIASDCHKDSTSTSTPHFVESEIQTSVEKKNVSTSFTNYLD